MAPTPQERRQTLTPGDVDPGLNGNSVVISGISGLFPMSENVKDFESILYNKINPVTSENTRFKWSHPEASEYIGKVLGLDRFDAQFFMVHNRLANCMDPMARKVLEQSYQALYDAGVNPKHFNGKKVGVFIAAALSEMEKYLFTDGVSKAGYRISGCSKTMYANRISYWLNAKGPSMTLDDACCGSMVALEEAYKAISSGMCEAAIVGGTNLCLMPHTQVHYNRCIKASPGAETKSFDENADGCTKSEAICVVFLQKAKDALRAYAEVVYVKNEFVSQLNGETGQSFGFFRNPNSTAEFLERFYSEANIHPEAVEYVEAFGSATPEADKAELQAIEKIFCNNRTHPLLVGSVISNVGFTGATSGATAITKVLLGYHRGLLASNLHCKTPRQDIPAIRDGRMCIVTDHRPFRGTYAAVNCLSVTGINSHVLLRGCSKSKDLNRYKTSIPRLVTLSARQEAHLKYIFEALKSQPIDPEELSLLQNIHSTNVSGHLGRGYIILDTDEQKKTVSLSETMTHSDEVRRPLWFVYSGMGSQWAGMGEQLMRIPIFAAAIERCQRALKPKGIDLVHIITSPDKAIFDNVLNSFVGIAAIQIGLTDILTALELHPDNIIGHSVGELGCAYADGCLTAEEMILSAYSRGKASNDTPLIRGAMAAIGLGYQQLAKLCPPSIEIACHNSSGSSTISGPEENIREFVALLTANGIFAKEVPSANIAYHSRYIADAGPNLLRLLSEIIREPKERSERWVSTSVPQERWSEPLVKYCSPEYLTNNLLSSVYFEETSKLIPSNAVLVEIAPHGLLQAILKRSQPQTCKNIPLTQRGHKDNTLFLLDAIGKLYVEGYNPQVQDIYPKVEFPVSSGTPHLSQYVKWNHSETWVVSGQSNSCIKSAASCKFLITTHDDEHIYLKGNFIQGKVVYPFAGALVAVWDTLAMTLGFPKKAVSVRFHDVHLFTQPILHDQKLLKLNVALHRGSGRFEVLDDDTKVATGYISTTSSIPIQYQSPERVENSLISSNEVYKHLNGRGYLYREEFQSIHTIDESLSISQIVWNNNWVTLIDGLLQLNTLRQQYEGVSQPTEIRELTIDVENHQESIERSPLDGRTVIRAEIDKVLDCTRCGGVSIQNLKFRSLPSLPQQIFKLKTATLFGNEVSRYNIERGLNNNPPGEKIALQLNTVGDLDDLHWDEAQDLSRNGVKVSVEYAGINVADVKRATGVIPFENNEKLFGMDFSGLTERGERVMGLVKNGAASTVVSASPELLWPVPTYWTLEEAATVPLAYVQAFYCLCVKTELQKGWRVMIHGAAGALGQAAISIALTHGCEVFATVRDNAKKRFLLRLFPQLKEAAIGNSRDATFGDLVLNATNGKGCNIVLCCAQGSLKDIALKCAAFSGVTIDTVQILNRDPYEYGMFHMTKQRSYIAVDIYSIFEKGNIVELRKLQTLVSDGIARGFVRPLSRVSFAPDETPRAFRLLTASNHRGRVLLQLRNSLAAHTQPTLTRIVCSPQKSHLIVCDGNSFGLQLADRLITRGARKLRIYCLNPTSQHNMIQLLLWQKTGVDVKILEDKLNSHKAVTAVIDEANQSGPVEGIYVAVATVFDKKQNTEMDIIDCFDTTSRVMCSHLKYFAVITVNGNLGHKTCASRFNEGFPATSLNIPEYDNTKHVEFVATEAFWNQAVLDVTELAFRSKYPIVSVEPQTAEKLSLSSLLATLFDKNNKDCTLQDLEITDSLIPCIKSLLRDVYNVSLDDEDVYKLTKKKILEIERNLHEHDYEEVKGLGKFFSCVDLDELNATAEVTPLSSLVCDVKTMDDGIDNSKTSLFIIPGLEGNYARFRTLCERLKLPTFVLQPALDHPNETPQELATRFSKVLLDTFKLKGKFYLLGYECGVFVALELASILEDHGLTGTVYCIGDSPEELKALLEAELKIFGCEESLQEGVARHMSSLMCGGSAAAAEVALRGCGSWRARVDACVRALLGRVPHSAQYARALLEAAYARLGTARRYSAAPRALRSRLVLLRTARSGDECQLQRYSTQPLRVHHLDAPLSHAAQDLRAPAIINRYLDDDILDTYNKSNLCESYLA